MWLIGPQADLSWRSRIAHVLTAKGRSFEHGGRISASGLIELPGLGNDKLALSTLCCEGWYAAELGIQCQQT